MSRRLLLRLLRELLTHRLPRLLLPPFRHRLRLTFRLLPGGLLRRPSLVRRSLLLLNRRLRLSLTRLSLARRLPARWLLVRSVVKRRLPTRWLPT